MLTITTNLSLKYANVQSKPLKCQRREIKLFNEKRRSSTLCCKRANGVQTLLSVRFLVTREKTG